LRTPESVAVRGKQFEYYWSMYSTQLSVSLGVPLLTSVRVC